MTTPSSPTDRQKLKTMLDAVTHCMQRADDEREAKKALIQEIFEEFQIPKKQLNKIAKTMHKRNFKDVVEEQKDFEELYETLVEGKLTP